MCRSPWEGMGAAIWEEPSKQECGSLGFRVTCEIPVGSGIRPSDTGDLGALGMGMAHFSS